MDKDLTNSAVIRQNVLNNKYAVDEIQKTIGGMLLTDSEKARQLRSVVLDIVIDVINKRSGATTKYINQRDEDFVMNYMRGEDYRKQFVDALHDCVDMGNFK